MSLFICMLQCNLTPAAALHIHCNTQMYRKPVATRDSLLLFTDISCHHFLKTTVVYNCRIKTFQYFFVFIHYWDNSDYAMLNSTLCIFFIGPKVMHIKNRNKQLQHVKMY